MASFKHYPNQPLPPMKIPDLSEMPPVGNALTILQQPPPPRPPQLVTGLLDRVGVGFLLGASHAGKTTISLNIAIAVAAGVPVLANPEWQTDGAEVLYICLDHQIDPLRQRIQTITTNHQIFPPTGIRFHTDWWPLHESLGHACLMKTLAASPDIRLVVIDALPPMPSPLVTGAIDALRLAAETYKTYILVNRHITRVSSALRYNSYHNPDDLHIAYYHGSNRQKPFIRTSQRTHASRAYDL